LSLTLHLVRHAPTLPNAERRYPRPQEDAGLSEAGRALARTLRLPADALAFASPSRRARETATLAGFGHAAPAPALAEARFGVMAGHTWAELEAAFGDAPRRWLDALSDPASDGGPPEGETGRAFHARILAWLAALPEAGEVVACTHAGPLHAALRLSVGLRAVETPPGTVATLRRAEGHWWLVRLTPPPVIQQPVTPTQAQSPPVPGGVPMPTPLHPDLAALIAAVQPAEPAAMQAARERQAQLTKPAGALGELEDLGVRLAGVFGSERPHPRGVAVLVAAGDHGVAAGGVSAYPPEVTPAMVANFLADTPAGPGGAAVNALARTVGARVYVMDAGVNADLPDHPALVRAALRRGTRDLRTQSAMTHAETQALILAGAALARRAVAEGADLRR
jgi:broad specificity phosphatase PhoE